MYTSGLKLSLIAKILKIKSATLNQWIKDFRTGSSQPKTMHSLEIKEFEELINYLNLKTKMSKTNEALLIVDFKEGTSKLFIEDNKQ
ncbi:MAG TPA: hypothetical protein PKX92_10800 [Edaphocola sp.]|nr:hypothetical protein [Edaphocola sp.]